MHQGGNDIRAAGSFVVYNYSATIQTPESWIDPSKSWSPTEERKSHMIDKTDFYLDFSGNTGTAMINAANDAVDDFDDSTSLNKTSSTGDFRIWIDETNMGPYVPYAGWARPKRGSNYCYMPSSHQPTGHCNLTNKQADSGEIYLNTYYYNTRSRDYLALHEMGHIFGLYHVDCLINSVMKDSCSSYPTSLQKLEKVWIDLNYP